MKKNNKLFLIITVIIIALLAITYRPLSRILSYYSIVDEDWVVEYLEVKPEYLDVAPPANVKVLNLGCLGFALSEEKVKDIFLVDSTNFEISDDGVSPIYNSDILVELDAYSFTIQLYKVYDVEWYEKSREIYQKVLLAEKKSIFQIISMKENEFKEYLFCVAARRSAPTAKEIFVVEQENLMLIFFLFDDNAFGRVWNKSADVYYHYHMNLRRGDGKETMKKLIKDFVSIIVNPEEGLIFNSPLEWVKWLHEDCGYEFREVEFSE